MSIFKKKMHLVSSLLMQDFNLMLHKIFKPKQAFIKVFLKVKPDGSEIEGFKTNPTNLIDHSNEIGFEAEGVAE